MRHASLLVTCASILLATTSVPVLGQTATAALTGVVQDSTGNVLDAVEVTATNVATGFAYRTASTGTGRYWLVGLPPGRYDIVASRLGVETTRYEDVALPVGKTLTLDFTVAIAALEIPAINVVAARRLVASTQADIAFSIDQEIIRNLPEESRSFMDLAALAPGATFGLTTFGTTNFGSAVSVGALNAHSMGVLVDGADFTEPAFGDVAGGIPLLAIQEFVVLQTSYSAELGRAASGIVNAVTRRGGNELEVEAFALFRDHRLNALGEFEQTKPDFDRRHWGFAVGGPIVQDRTHYFVAFERKVENNFVTIETGNAVPGVDGTFETPFNNNLPFARLDHRISDTQELTLRYAGEIGDKLAGVGQRTAFSAASNISTRLHSGLLTHRWSITDGLLNQARLHVIRRTYRNSQAGDPGPTLCYPSICTGSSQDSESLSYTRVELMDDVSFVATGPGGTHRLKFGTQLSWQDNRARFGIANNGLFVFPADDAPFPVAALVGIGANGPVSRNTQIAVFAQDEWNPTPSLTLSLGLRYEIETNGTNQGYVSPLAGQLPFVRTTPRPIDKNNIGPRIGFAWDPSVDGRTVIRGGFGIFYDALPAHSLGSGLEANSGDVLTGTIFGPTTFDVDQLIEDNPGAFGELHWPNAADLRTPMTRQFSLGFQQTLPYEVVFRVDGLMIQGRNIPMERSLNTFDPITGPAFPGLGLVLQMLTEGTADARLLMMVLSRNFDDGWLNLSYTLGDRKNTSDSWNDFVQGSLDPDVTDFSNLKGRAAWDDRHRVVATGGMDFPFGLSASGKFIYSSARPFTALTIMDLNGDGFSNDRVAGEPRNGRTGPDFLRLDLGLGWHFTVREGRQVGVQFNVYNVSNRTNLDPASVSLFTEAPTFGEAAVAFHKRLAEIGVTIR